MFQVSLMRIDCRVVHGQIAIYWATAAKADVIYVVDEAISKNTFLTNLYKNSAPQSIKAVEVFSPESFMEAVENKNTVDGNVLMIFKDVANCYKLFKLGYPFKEVNVGNQATNPKKKQILREIFLSEEEMQQLKEIEASGTDVYLQVIPSQAKMDLKTAESKMK